MHSFRPKLNNLSIAALPCNGRIIQHGDGGHQDDREDDGEDLHDDQDSGNDDLSCGGHESGSEK